MMEEQVQMLSKPITQRKQTRQTGSQPQTVAVAMEESTRPSTRPEAQAGPVMTRRGTDTPIEIVEDSPDVSMDETADLSGEATAGSRTEAVDTSEGNDTPIGIVLISPNVSMTVSADGLDKTPAEPETAILDGTAEDQHDVATDVPTAGEAEARAGNVDAIEAAQVTDE